MIGDDIFYGDDEESEVSNESGDKDYANSDSNISVDAGSEANLNVEDDLCCDQYCDNCLRSQSEYLEGLTCNVYKLEFTIRKSSQIIRRNKFRHISIPKKEEVEIMLCKECDNYLMNNDAASKSSMNVWPAFICSILLNKEVIEKYGVLIWKLIPKIWRHWWLKEMNKYQHLSDVTIDEPEPIIIDKTIEQSEWQSDTESLLLPKIANACNKYMMPTILCPWGCSEFIFSNGIIQLDLIFQRFLQKVNIDIIEDKDKLKRVKYCRDDYIRFNGEYDSWLLNEKDWKVMPSVIYVPDKGMQFMVCKEHCQGTTKAYVHPPRQPNHILPCKYSDQICHAVIKPRTITQMKAQKYSNCFQMMEQRGNFNGIDTCNVTQYRDFQLLSVLLEEYESRSIIGRPDINALLDQFVHEGQISPEIAESYRNTARIKSKDIDIESLCYGATYVPPKIALQMEEEKKLTKVTIESNDVNAEESFYIKTQFPPYVYPIQKSNEYGATPILIPNLKLKDKDTSMLWSLIGILVLVEEAWDLVRKLEMRQNNWHGWILTYITRTCMTHHSTRPNKKDPFKIPKRDITSFMLKKIVSRIYIYVSLFKII